MAITLILLALLLISMIPLFVCAVFARLDAIRGQRRFGQRIFYTALVCSVLFGGIILLFFFAIIAPQAPPGASVVMATEGILFGCGIVFLTSAFTGSIGYATSYRLFDRGQVRREDYPIDPEARGEETGNPYQPPSV